MRIRVRLTPSWWLTASASRMDDAYAVMELCGDILETYATMIDTALPLETSPASFPEPQADVRADERRKIAESLRLLFSTVTTSWDLARLMTEVQVLVGGRHG